VISANAKELVYFSVKVFFHSILSIYFSSMEVLGRENIPDHGPVIFTGNHMNQFVDGAVMMVTSPLRVGLLVAEKSYNKRIIGDFAKATGSIPVSRPQDCAKAGPGKIKFDGLKIIGTDTKFTAIKKGDRIRPGKSPESYRIKEVISDNEGILADEYGEASPLSETFAHTWITYDILKHVDQSEMFDSVQKALANGQCLGIFPEGGSHDRTDLLPLKAGVAAIALGALEKYGVSVPIVPVGLNYFRGHRFRGRVVVEYGVRKLRFYFFFFFNHFIASCSYYCRYHGSLSRLQEKRLSTVVTKCGRRHAIGDCDCFRLQ
jgi:glycerol-3-phosphate O-acyltransferase/dihydroxyacetone phosphate acyltransferase